MSFAYLLLAFGGGGGSVRPGTDFVDNLPNGVFKTLLQLWSTVKDTYVTVFEWMGNNAFGTNGSVLMALVGSGLFVVLAYWIVKFFIP